MKVLEKCIRAIAGGEHDMNKIITSFTIKFDYKQVRKVFNQKEKLTKLIVKL